MKACMLTCMHVLKCLRVRDSGGGGGGGRHTIPWEDFYSSMLVKSMSPRI